VFTSDNGYFWREHGLGDKRWAYEPSLRAPLLVRYPPLVKAGRRLEQMVLNIDLAPTFLDLGKVKVPADVQGRSLAPLLRDEKTKWRTGFLAEYFRDGKFPHPPWQAARTARWKYIRYPDDPKWDELYDLQADPHELKNLASDAGAQARLKQMQDELARLHKEAGAK
jgi:arylsulfatase A-like enzyme